MKLFSKNHLFMSLLSSSLLLCFAFTSAAEAKSFSAKKNGAIHSSIKERETFELKTMGGRLKGSVMSFGRNKSQTQITGVKGRGSQTFGLRKSPGAQLSVRTGSNRIGSVKGSQLWVRKNPQVRVTSVRTQPQIALARGRQFQALAAKPALGAKTFQHPSVGVRSNLYARNLSVGRLQPKSISTRPQIPLLQTKLSLPTKSLVPLKQLVNTYTSTLKPPPHKPSLPNNLLPYVKPSPVNQPVINSFFHQNPYTKRNAELGRLDKLYAKNISGLGQTTAVIEYSGVWQKIKDIINNEVWILPRGVKERYKRNFLTPIGGGFLHPEVKNDWVRMATVESNFHGSSVSSVIMDFSQAKVLPVSTYNSPQQGAQPHHFYDTADALMDLARRKDVGIINISSGYIRLLPSESKFVRDVNGQLIIVSKDVFAPKIIEAFKAIARAGKVVVLAAGNDGGFIQPPEFTRELRVKTKHFIGHLLDTLDPETRKAIIIAGNINPNTHRLSHTCNRPGNWVKAQERFVGVPGYHMLSHVDFVVEGSSFAGPYLSAAIALLSSRGYAPQRAAQALLETAEKDPDVSTYGKGRMIRADRALEWLERGR